MIKRRRFPHIYFGWWTALGGGYITMWAVGFYTYGFSALFKPIASELNFSRAAASVPPSMGRLGGGFEAPLSGWATDRFGPRLILLSSVFIMGLGLVLMYFVNSLWAYYVVWGIILSTGFNVAMVPPDKAVTDWFVKKRGVALSLKWALMGLSGVLILPFVAWLIQNVGWRQACLIGGVIILTTCSLIAWFLVKPRRPEYYGLLPDGVKGDESLRDKSLAINKGVKYAAEVEEVEFTLRQAMKTPAFWILTGANAMYSLAYPVISIHTVPFLTDMGIEPFAAAGIMALAISTSIPLRLVGGFLADRVKKNQMRFIVMGAYFTQSLGTTIFLLNQTVPMTYVFLISFFVGHGAVVVPLPALRARYFGRKAFASIQGVTQGVAAPAGVAAPILAGWIYDTTGNYIPAFIMLAIVLGIAAVLVVFALPPKPPTQVTDVRKIV